MTYIRTYERAHVNMKEHTYTFALEYAHVRIHTHSYTRIRAHIIRLIELR